MVDIVLSIFFAGLSPRLSGRKDRPATSEATLLYRARIGEGMQTPFQSLASSQRDVSLLLTYSGWRLINRLIL